MTPGTGQPRRPPPQWARGFTLLELLVVLLLLALASGLVAPWGFRALANAQERGWRNDLLATLQALPAQAFLRGQAMEIDAAGLRQMVPDAPEGIALTLDRPMRYAMNGAAGGGQLTVSFIGRAPERWRVLPLTGEVVRDEP